MPDFPSLDLVPLLWACLLGGAVGLEREWNGRPAGLRTHLLVCLSSTMLVRISREAAELSVAPDSLVFDPNRMAAGIVTGIGFLGAATVLRSGDFLRGLTTAACIWYVAGLGIVLGNEHYALGIVGTAIVLLALTYLHVWSSRIRPVIFRRLQLSHSREDADALSREVIELLAAERVRVIDVASSHDNTTGRHELVFFVSLKNLLQSPRLANRVAELRGVGSASWMPTTEPT